MKRILIVDDIEENLYLLRVLLEGHGYEVMQAGNGGEAIIKALSWFPDMVISDILMPVIDGFTLCRIWKADERLKRSPFIFYTATYTDPLDERLALDMGADAFIVKPTEPDEFLSKIESILTIDMDHMLAFPKEPKQGDETILKQYNVTLIRKLEHKMSELERVNHELEAEIAAKSRIEATLRESEELFRNLFHQHAAVKLIIDPETGNIIDANQSAVDFYGWPRERLLEMKIQDINMLPAKDVEEAMAMVGLQGRISFEFRHRKADGSVRDVEVFSSRIMVQGKDLLHSIIHDITDRKRAEEAITASLREKEVLLKEVHHRVKNNLQVISSLMSLQSGHIKKSEDAQAALFDMQNRIRSMALVHDMLYRTEHFSSINFKIYIESIIATMYKSTVTVGDTMRIESDVQALTLGIDDAIPCGLILNELITNALKHAFPGGREGVIKVSMGANEDGYLYLSVKDNGVGLPEGFLLDSVETLGLHLVVLLSKQLDGVLTASNVDGAEICLKFRRHGER